MNGGVRIAVISAVLVTLSACGPEFVRSEPSAPEAQLQSSTGEVIPAKKTLVPVRAQRVESEVQPRSQPRLLAPALTIAATGASVSDGTPIHAVMGIMGCGFMETGRGESLVQSGAAQLSLISTEPIGYGGTLLVFVDNDRDGKCDATAGDQLWEMPLTTTSLPATMAIDLSTPSSDASWACGMFARQN